MVIGVPKEIKTREYRVGLTPASVRELVRRGHEVVVQSEAGREIGFPDDVYKASGARLAGTAQAVFEEAKLIVKVKEPQTNEWGMLRQEHILFTYLHLAPDMEQIRGLMDSGCTAIAYETVTDQFGGLPLLAPMSEVAGPVTATWMATRYSSMPMARTTIRIHGKTTTTDSRRVRYV